MKYTDILFLLTAAATANAILIPFKKDSPSQASDIFSQVSSPTNEPNPSAPGENWQGLINAINSRVSNENWQQSINEPSPSTSSQDQQNPMDVASSGTFSQSKQHLTNELGPEVFEEDWKILMDQSDPSIHEDWKSLIDTINSINSNQDQQLPMDQPGPSTSSQGHQLPMDQPGPSTSSQGHQQPMNVANPNHTGSSQRIVLSRRQQTVLDSRKTKLKNAKKLKKVKHKIYYDYVALGLDQHLKEVLNQDTSESTYSPNTEKQYKKDYKAAKKKVYNIRQRLKDLMKKHDLKFEEPNSDSD
ncbi:hypothetical protein BATDEDRAFT_92064 [Batrachochytrium dendrobatidis JAM81]|uniref:Uncharacterized protein n=1 Tax=Batrachochytrium dendrobatidis (strain JAM81 / FGSC 10211) TaxID=684364 RepID=F4PC03_BATDJ|nr:uncharacterized protein BATDEDRAFT_92064 [Batrachochytrium dendrobatidis JAM81]EGF77104.1 hypothetical protein BATDEDRAFT_92064 [Batrachochytrium dendrobatidis JAM81]|eukprot:XP_006682278.1 hypothetical protein BATDEDRAFT_92064 [Batrachochytrium dendrobatidis JAM81]